jgi:hypothetical protein
MFTTLVKEMMMRISAVVNGTMIYHFRKADIEALKRLVAGKSREQVGRMILQFQGIPMVGIELHYHQESLPSDPEKIRVRMKP